MFAMQGFKIVITGFFLQIINKLFDRKKIIHSYMTKKKQTSSRVSTSLISLLTYAFPH